MSLRYLSISQIAEITGMDRRTVKSKLAGVEPFKTHGKAILYDANEVLALKYTVADDTPENASQALAEATLKLEQARADKARLEADKMAGLLVAIEDVARAVEKEYTYVRATLYAMPSKIAKGLASEEDPAVIQKQLHTAVDEALAHLQADTNLEFTPEEENEEADTDE